MDSVREAWTDERLDDLNHRVDEGFREMREEFRASRGRRSSIRFDRGRCASGRMQRTMVQAARRDDRRHADGLRQARCADRHAGLTVGLVLPLGLADRGRRLGSAARLDGLVSARPAARAGPPSPPSRASPARSPWPGRRGPRRSREGSSRAHWRPPTAPWRASRPRTTPRGLWARLSPPGRRSRSQTAIAARPKTVAIAEWRWTTHSRVPVPSKSKRWTSWPSWAPAWGPEAVAIVPARIVSWPSGISARTAQTPRRSLERAPLAGLVARAPGEREGGVEEQHREDEVAHHQARRQVVLDDQGAEDRLADHAQRQQRAEQRQVPAERPAEEGEHAGGDHGEADEAGQQPVAVLDHRVGVERRHRPAVALGPVRAAEPGAGQPHPGAGEDDQRQRRRGRPASPSRRAAG